MNAEPRVIANAENLPAAFAAKAVRRWNRLPNPRSLFVSCGVATNSLVALAGAPAALDAARPRITDTTVTGEDVIAALNQLTNKIVSSTYEP